MPWPQALEYNAAVQCPSACFRDPELRQTKVRTNALGMPTPHSGNFADVYQLEGPAGASWAVKCFTRAIKGLQERYQAISGHLRDDPRSFMVDFQYLEGGIHVGSAWYPTVKMRWVEGFALNRFVADHAEDRMVLEKLAELWLKLALQLQDTSMAHGDLQHGNVLLVPGSKAHSLALRLVDYDGLFVPALAESPSGEFGHPNYQHPQRTPHPLANDPRPPENGYGPHMDRFSLLVVYTALRAMALDGKTLWRAFDCGENLLFRDVDFREPAESRLFKRLWTDFGGDVRSLAGRLLLASQGLLGTVPAVTDLVEGGKVQPVTKEEEEWVAHLLKIPAAPSRPKITPAAPAAATPLPRTAPRTPTPAVPSRDRVLSPITPPNVPALTAEQRRAAVGQFERANQVIATGNYDYGLKLLLSCCTLDRANLIYRQALRRTEKAKYKDNLRGAWLSWLTTLPGKARLRAALRAGDHLKVLDLAERVLLRNPWHVGTQVALATAADELGLVDLAVWSLEQARQQDATNPLVNRALALVYEKRGNFTQAMALWMLVRKARPNDQEAQTKLKDLAVSDTIQRGKYAEAAAQSAEANGNEPIDQAPAAAGSKPYRALQPGASRGELPAAASAADALRKRIDADPTDPKTYLQLAHFHRKGNAFEEARAVLQEGLGPTGNAFELIAEMADVEIEPFRRDLAITEEKLKADPDSVELRQHRARLKKEINTRELDLFRRKADRFPTEAGYRLDVGIRLFRVGQIDEAIRELQGVRTDPRFAGKAAYHLGHCFRGRNNLRLAQRNFEEALQNLPPGDHEMRKDAIYSLAQTCADSGDLPRAIDLATDLAHEDYSFRDVGRLLDEWQAKLRQKV